MISAVENHPLLPPNVKDMLTRLIESADLAKESRLRSAAEGASSMTPTVPQEEATTRVKKTPSPTGRSATPESVLGTKYGGGGHQRELEVTSMMNRFLEEKRSLEEDL